MFLRESGAKYQSNIDIIYIMLYLLVCVSMSVGSILGFFIRINDIYSKSTINNTNITVITMKTRKKNKIANLEFHKSFA